MERHGRQQLLAPQFSKKSLSKKWQRKKGQSLVELLPAIVLFFTVLVGAFSYFKVMRSAVVRQEVVRNMAFAAIGNMGSLTTPPDQLSSAKGDPLESGPSLRGLGGERFISSSNQVFVGGATRCFRLYPRDTTISLSTPLPSFFQDSPPQVQFSTYAVVQRLPDGDCN